jgi:hypothetical protein
VRVALGLINQALDEILAEQEGEYAAETRWALAWFEQYGVNEGKFGDAETLSRVKDTAVNALEEAGIIKAKAGKVQLVEREGLSADWDPASESRLTVWELTQHLIRAIENRRRDGCGADYPACRLARRDRQGPRISALRDMRSQGMVAGSARLQHAGQVLAGTCPPCVGCRTTKSQLWLGPSEQQKVPSG